MRSLKYISLIIVTFGLAGCGREPDITGKYFDANDKLVLTFNADETVSIAGSNGKGINYYRNGKRIKIISEQFVAPLELSIEENGSLTFSNHVFVKK